MSETMTLMRLAFLLAAAVVSTAAACTGNQQAEPALIVLEGATNVRSEAGFGPRGVEYDLPSGDGNAVITELHRRLTAAGWQPTSELVELRQPGSSSFTTGWLCFPPSPDHPREPFRYHWVANWRGPRGDVASYTVLCSTEPPRCERLEVAAYVLASETIPNGDTLRTIGGTPHTGISTQCTELRQAARDGTLRAQ